MCDKSTSPVPCRASAPFSNLIPHQFPLNRVRPAERFLLTVLWLRLVSALQIVWIIAMSFSDFPSDFSAFSFTVFAFVAFALAVAALLGCRVRVAVG